jgi:hypothetical protein
VVRKSFEHARLRIVVEEDDSPVSPREQFDRIGHLVCWNASAVLGDELPPAVDTVASELARARGARVWLPLWVIQADGKLGIRMGLASEPDAASADGLIYATARDIKRRMKLLRISRRDVSRAASILRQEVEDYVQFVRNEMLQFLILDRDGELVDRCGGFYTETYAREEAMQVAEHHAAQLLRYAPARLTGGERELDADAV